MNDFIAGDDYWELTPDPGLVERALEVHISGESELRLNILSGKDEWDLSFSPHSYEVTTQGGQRSNLPIKALTRKHVTRLRALKSGGLYVTFDDGVTLNVEPALEYEAWEIRRNGDIIMFAPLSGAELDF